MASAWEMMLDSDLPSSDEPSELLIGPGDYDERPVDDDAGSEYFEYLSSTRKLPSAQWGLDSTRDPAQKAEWE